MDSAYCTLNNKHYQATVFSYLPSAELEEKRKFLACPECHKPAFFRKASRSGQAACFGARPHEEGCTLATYEHGENDNNLGNEQDILYNPGQHIVLDLDFGTPDSKNENSIKDHAEAYMHGGRFVGNGFRPNAAMHLRLSRILRDLMTIEEFRSSQQTIEINTAKRYIVANFFVPFNSVTALHNQHYHGYWGMIVSARFGAQGCFGQRGPLWLNSGGKNNISILVPERFVDALYKRFQIISEEELAGCYAIALGTLQISNKQKKYIAVEDLSFISIR